jgi:hypothetical protein
MSLSEPVEKLLAQLEGVRRNGSGAMARCPAHEDGTASLSIREGDDGCALITCHAGCPRERIVAAVNLTMADLFDAATRRKSAGQTKKSGGLGRVVAKYEYRDERGEVRYFIFRYDPKTFRPWRPNGHGGLISNLDGVTPLPYRLPELLAAIGRDELVPLRAYRMEHGVRLVEVALESGINAARVSTLERDMLRAHEGAGEIERLLRAVDKVAARRQEKRA